MKCPDCEKKLKKVSTTSHYGAKIVLDQCSDCGGIWFDDFELHPIPKKEIEKIESVDIDRLQKKSLLSKRGNNLCPKCSIELEIFKDYNFPKQLEVEYCQNCSGLWMNRGEATDFKSWQERKIAKSSEPLVGEDKKFQEEIKSLLTSHKSGNFGMLGKIGKTLSTRIDPRTHRTIERDGHMETREENEIKRSASFIVEIMSMLLRLFLRY